MQPTLLERGTTEHLKTSLAECRLTRHSQISTIINIILFVLFISVLWIIYKYKDSGKKQNNKEKSVIAEQNLMTMLQRSGSRLAVQNNMTSW